jgi:ribosomal protein L37AE/L43A
VGYEDLPDDATERQKQSKENAKIKRKMKIDEMNKPISACEIISRNNIKCILGDTESSIYNIKQQLCKKDKEYRIVRSILSHTEYLAKSSKFSERVYHIKNDISAPVCCPICNKRLRFFSITTGYNGCSNCSITSSAGEREVADFVLELGVEVKSKVKSKVRSLLKNTRKEIDIYLPEHRVGIEYNGEYWHNENIINKEDHLKKTQMCEDKNINLIHIFSVEWHNKQQLIKSMIKEAIGRQTAAEYKDFIIKEVGVTEKAQFLNNSHIEGDCKTHLNLAIVESSIIKSICCLTKKTNDWTIVRYCGCGDTHNAMGFAMILKYFLTYYYKNNDTLCLIHNRRFPTPVYISNEDFIEKTTTKPRPLYYQTNAKEILDEEKYAKLNVENNSKWLKLWDCGCVVLEYKKSHDK